jgi:hypothetical protein
MSARLDLLYPGLIQPLSALHVDIEGSQDREIHRKLKIIEFGNQMATLFVGSQYFSGNVLDGVQWGYSL